MTQWWVDGWLIDDSMVGGWVVEQSISQSSTNKTRRETFDWGWKKMNFNGGLNEKRWFKMRN